MMTTFDDEYDDDVDGPVVCISCEETMPEAYVHNGDGFYCLDCYRALNTIDEEL